MRALLTAPNASFLKPRQPEVVWHVEPVNHADVLTLVAVQPPASR